MSDYWCDLASGSQNHVAKQTKNVITIGPASDTQAALDAFQPVANAAIQQAAMDGFHAQTHNSSRWSGLDMIAINLSLD